jgi:hypothetical protein
VSDSHVYEWGGWSYDASLRKVVRPVKMFLKSGEGRLFLELILSEGKVLTDHEVCLRCGWAAASVKVFVSKIRSLLGRHSIITVRGIGMRLSPADKMDEEARLVEQKRQRLVELFKDQFEATGPHARAVAKTVLMMFGEQ